MSRPLNTRAVQEAESVVRRILAELTPQSSPEDGPVSAEEHRVHAEAGSLVARAGSFEHALSELVAWAEDRELPVLQARFREFGQEPRVRCVRDYIWWAEVVG